MRRSVALLLALVALGLAVMFAGIGGSASHVSKAHAGAIGIDDEMNTEQERLLSGFASFELARSGNNSDANTDQKPDNYSFILVNPEGEPVELTGARLRALRDGGEIAIHPATYRLVYDLDE